MFLYFLTLISAMAFCIEGHFEFSNQYEVIQEKKVQILDARFSKNKEKMKELKKQGYQCSRIVGHYKCRYFVKPPHLPQGFEVLPKRQKIHFGPILGKDYITEEPDFIQYDAVQAVTIDTLVYQDVNYIERPDLKKAKVGLESPQEPVYFVLGENQVSEMQFYRKTHNRDEWTEYIVEVIYGAVPARDK